WLRSSSLLLRAVSCQMTVYTKLITPSTLHWLTLVLLVAQFALGWLMPEADEIKVPSGLVAWHIGVGASLLVVIVARVGWALVRRAPTPVDQSPELRAVANILHMALYALLILVPLLGWLNADGRGWVVKLAGVVQFPQISNPSSPDLSIGDLHSASATILLILIGVHVFAVLVHQNIFKDRLMRRML
ncbi:cytochrome b, partial [Caballeronia arationis]